MSALVQARRKPGGGSVGGRMVQLLSPENRRLKTSELYLVGKSTQVPVYNPAARRYRYRVRTYDTMQTVTFPSRCSRAERSIC